MASKALKRIDGKYETHVQNCLKAIERGLRRAGKRTQWTYDFGFDVANRGAEGDLGTERGTGFELRLEKLDADGQPTYRDTGVVRYTAIVKVPTGQRDRGIAVRDRRSAEVKTVADAVRFVLGNL